MTPEYLVLVFSLIGVAVSGALLVDAALDRAAIRRLERERGEVEAELRVFTRARGVAETLRFLVLLAWLYASVVAIIGRGEIRGTIVWTLVGIPVLITASSIHSWWLKNKTYRRPDGRD